MSNHLINETSPYLLQHAENPVDWYPWGEQALEKARRENKPILLSIGYAACHWCHVMEHESFEDQETAELMNKLFVNIKVDREERPDLDKIYQTAHQILTQRGGGWPLTVFLTPDDLAPFYAGTYFPPTSHYQLPAFKEVLVSIADAYKQKSAEIKQQNAELIRILNYDKPVSISDVRLNDQPVQHALSVLRDHYDNTYGGFGTAPKFPQEPTLEFLLLNKSDLAAGTLFHMGKGGIFDQLGGGFFRYSVDPAWEIPHFEKMLYDNAQLLGLYAWGAREFKEHFFGVIAHETADWVINGMQSPEGGYYSSLDADSEGHEGQYYVWDKAEVKSALTEKEYAVIELMFGLDQSANFEHKLWHLRVVNSVDKVATQLKLSTEEVKELFLSAKTRLLAIRQTRVLPARDEKILTSWNSLMIKSLFIAGDILQNTRYLSSGLSALDFIQDKLWINKQLLATSKDGRAHLEAYLDDYAFLIDALLMALQTEWNSGHLHFAIELAEALLSKFYDKNRGGFFFTSEQHEKLLYRPKTMTDEAIPSGNAIAARVLLTLGHLLGEPRYLEAAEKTLQVAWPLLTRYPTQYCGLLIALQEYLHPPQIIVIRGDKNEIKKWRSACKRINNVVFSIPDDETMLPGALELKQARGKTCAYVCEGLHCLDVIEDLDTLCKS